ncbi:MAG: family 43 glycosylhydrolase [Fimbriimonadaceae bacterium]|nr:family 43 glycosylhydrolase [Fimbriimonadaceae bacterium]
MLATLACLLSPLTLAPPPRAELPRPDLARGTWSSLNGEWEFRFDPTAAGTVQHWEQPGATGYDRRIVVPYPWESRLSGIADPEYRGVAWYRRTFQAPAVAAGQRLHLCFGAVDWAAKVWLNGHYLGDHVGGYNAFRFDITALLQPGDNTLVVRAFDETDPRCPVGKQVGWYTRCSGIWQPVWLETVAPAHVTALAVDCQLTPPQATVQVTVQAPIAGPATLSLRPDEATVPAVTRRVDLPAGASVVELVLPVPGGQAWSPEQPRLYQYSLVLDQGGQQDIVRSYFGLRTIGVAPTAGREYSQIQLNGAPVYLRGALHQVFNPAGVYTFADDAAIRRDLEIAKELGWNFLRLHIKLVDPRFLYWADRLGVLLMADLPNTWQLSPTARENYELTLRQAIPRDRSHPSVIAWCCFNETWGLGGGQALKSDVVTQQWVEQMVALTRQLDPTRLIEDNSPCNNDHVCGDLHSWHFYIDNYEAARRHLRQVVDDTFEGSPWNFVPGRTQGRQPLLNSEYGAVGAGGGDRDVSWGFKYLTTLLRAEAKCQGYVYTEHCDIEWEHTGLTCYDRTKKAAGYEAFVPGMDYADLQGADFVGLDGPPVVKLAPGAPLEVAPFVSHYSSLTVTPRLRLAVTGCDALGRPLPVTVIAEAPVAWQAADVVKLPTMPVTLPPALAVGAVTAELLDGPRRLAANYQNVLVDRPAPAAEALDTTTVALRLAPSEVAAVDAPQAPNLLAELQRDKLAAPGRPSFTWRLRLPDALRGTDFQRLSLLLEAGACGGEAKLDWPARRSRLDYPQTKVGRATPSTLRARLAGVELGTAPLADDFADSRGVLSHLAGYQHGSHGERVELTFDLASQPALAAKLRAGEPLDLVLDQPTAAGHGLSVYGATMGRYPFGPTLLLTAAQLPVAAGWQSTAAVATDSLRGRQEVLSPTAEAGGSTWRYTLTAPPAGWQQADFNDAGWPEGKSSFGTAGTPGALVGTTWETPAIFLRRRLELSKPLGASDVLVLRVIHDEDVTVWLNGRRVLQRTGYVGDYFEEILSGDDRAALRAGRNMLAVQCHQTIGGQNIDVGLSVLRADAGTRVGRTYRNPLIDYHGAADPFCLRHDGKYYLYPTTDGQGYDVFVSDDLVSWQQHPKCYTDPRGGAWAPEVLRWSRDGKFYLYYTVNHPGGGKLVGVAKGDSPLGPFTDVRTLAVGSIDAHVFEDVDGSLYLYHVALPGGFRIVGQKLSDPVTIAGEPVELIRPTVPWEMAKGHVTEGPFMLLHNGVYYLTYSGSGADGPDYGIGYATARSPLGPFTKYANNPIARRRDGLYGPGHHSVVPGPDGRLWLVYHQQRTTKVGWDRFVALDPLWFNPDGTLACRLTRDTDQPAP